ncbi:hypothetical protein I4100191B2_18400 [Clostridiales bacterium]
MERSGSTSLTEKTGAGNVRAKQCGLSLSGYLRRVGVGKSTAAFLYQRFHALYQRSAVYAINSDSQPLEPTVAQLDELSGQILSDYAG